MELSERIARRQGTTPGSGVVVDQNPLNPAYHLDEPIGRGSVLERLLDVLDPVFRRDLPPDIAVYGPDGAGKSAVVTALFTQLDERLGRPQRSIQTSTRAQGNAGASWFVNVDARTSTSEFRFYHTILDAITEDPVPERGVGTDSLRKRTEQRLAGIDANAVVAVDHLDDSEGLTLSAVREFLSPVADSIALAIVVEKVPDGWSHETVHVPAYRQHTLVDILTERAERGLASGAFRHGQARRIAEWAGGDAHDALAALFGAAELASRDVAERIRADDIDRGIDAVPTDGVHIGRVLALPENRKDVLAELVTTDGHTSASIQEAAAAVAENADLSVGTVKRFLYELAESGILERVRIEDDDGSGRQPSRLEPQFPTLVFRTLHERTRA